MGREWLHSQAVHTIVAGFLIGASVVQVIWVLRSAETAANLVEAYDLGYKHALRTHRPSMDLEMACVSLWATKQGEMPEGK